MQVVRIEYRTCRNDKPVIVADEVIE